jgi:hypothetical protein
VGEIPLEDVFKIGGVPTYTFVEPSEYDRLRVALRTRGRGVIVEGPSGIGKSTAVEKALGSIGVEMGAQSLTARDPNDVGVIELLPTMTDFGIAIVDDFHVLDDAVRRGIADLLKRLADAESETSKLVIIGINRAGDSLIDAAPDLVNRLEVIRFEVEQPDKVRALIEAGEKAFNVEIEAKERIVEGALPREVFFGRFALDQTPLRNQGGRTTCITPEVAGSSPVAPCFHISCPYRRRPWWSRKPPLGCTRVLSPD